MGGLNIRKKYLDLKKNPNFYNLEYVQCQNLVLYWYKTDFAEIKTTQGTIDRTPENMLRAAAKIAAIPAATAAAKIALHLPDLRLPLVVEQACVVWKRSQRC